MTGGLLNLVSSGQQNIFLNGNPTKTFWKSSYKKYTNFGKQNFRLDYEGSPTLNLTSESTFVFKVKRYGDLLMDCYICIDLPMIWSPIYPPSDSSGEWVPYEFRWIENIGTQIISRITINCGNQKLQEYSGRYILSSSQRDLSKEKMELFNEMTGNIPELNDPGNSGARVNTYPNAFYTSNPAGAQPSIMGRTLYIPLGAYFCDKTVQAFPLVSLQQNLLTISVTFRPIYEWFTIRDVADVDNNYPIIAPNFNQQYMQFYRFLQTPPNEELTYIDTRTEWNANIHINSTYCFLSDLERNLYAKYEQKYLFKQVHETVYYNVTGSNKIELNSIGLVANWMFYFQRSDVNLRNQWSNYTNWPYNYMPSDLIPASAEGDYPNPATTDTIGPGSNPNGELTGLYITGIYNPQNLKEILISLGILLDGQYRENILDYGVYNYVEKYYRTAGNAPNGLYCYNFNLDTNLLQPSGAMNMNRFNMIQYEFNTIIPPINPYAQVLSICDPTSGDLVAVNKPSWIIYEYNYNLYVFEERYNEVIFVGGNAGLLYAT